MLASSDTRVLSPKAEKGVEGLFLLQEAPLPKLLYCFGGRDRNCWSELYLEVGAVCYCFLGNQLGRAGGVGLPPAGYTLVYHQRYLT